jgi:hypothetical protein
MASLSRLRNLAVNLAVCGVAGLLVLLAAEGVLRLLGGTPSDGGQGVPPVEERVAQTPAKRPGQIRMLALGDSFTEFRDTAGENWARFAAREADRNGVALDVWNLGQAGTSVPHYLRNLKDYGRALAPDVVAVGLYLGNDAFEYELEIEKKRRGLAPNPVTTRGRRPGGTLARLRSTLRLADAVVRLRKEMAARAGSRHTTFDANLEHAAQIYGLAPTDRDAALAKADGEMVRLARADVLNGWDLAFGIVRPQRYVEQILLPDGSPASAAMEAMEQDLLAFDRECRAISRACVYVVIPCSLQVHPRHFAYYEKLGFATDPRTIGESPLRARVRAFFETHHLVAVDPLDALRESTLDPYLPFDTHLSVAGQEIVGRVTWSRLRPLIAPR